jgi:hypothetical protein
LGFTGKLYDGSGNVGSGLINNLAADASGLMLGVLLLSDGGLCSV